MTKNAMRGMRGMKVPHYSHNCRGGKLCGLHRTPHGLSAEPTARSYLLARRRRRLAVAVATVAAVTPALRTVVPSSG